MSDVETANQALQPASASSAVAAGSPALRLLRQPRFMVAAVILLVGAIGFNAASLALQLHFRKLPLPLRVPALDDKEKGIPARINNRWLKIYADRPMEPDVEKTLGTKQYLTRTYVDLKKLPNPALEQQLLSEDTNVQKRALAELATKSPEAVISLHMAYYTGLVDTVAHIPDRCMVASGFRQVEDARTIDGPSRDGSNAKFRFLSFEDIMGNADVRNYQVGYLFHVNGAYEADPLGVRARLQSLFEKYGYYAKIEMSIQQVQRTLQKADEQQVQRSAESMSAFLEDLLPEVERCLPDWAAATSSAASK